ncbi:MAG TPA: condensation domain-containing protein, partial [Thermoanaerobaculia bacterium]
AAGLAAAVEEALRAGRRPAEPPRLRPCGGDAPLTSGQERLWFLDRLQPGAAYNVPLEARLEGELSLPALSAAIAELERRHEALRSTFPQAGDGPVQRVAAAGRPDLPLVDLSRLEEPRRSGEADRLAREEARRPFDLAAGPVARRRLLRLAAGRHRLVWALHHIVCDGRSLEILLEELAVLYVAARAGSVSPWPAPPLQLADVAVWERQRLTGPGPDESLRYWERKLAQAPVLELPTDRPRPAARSSRGGTRSLELSAPAARSVAALARRERTTPFLFLLAVYAAQLHRCCEQRDITVGAPVAGRGAGGLDRVVGFLVNTIALRIEVERDLPFRELLARVRRCGVEAFGHADIPFERVVEKLHPERALSLHPIFLATFALRPAPAPVVLPGLELAPRAVDTGTAKLDLGMSVDWSEDGLAAALEYAADLFDAATADRLLAGFATLLAGVLEDPERTVGNLPLLPEAERRQVLAAWGDRSAPQPACVHVEVAAWAERCPDALAVEEEGIRLTYRELNLRAGAVARRLRELGVGPDSIVAVLARRCSLLVTAALGALKAGGAYAPLDPSSPAERLAAMLESAGAPMVLAEGDLLSRLPPGYASPVLEIGEAAAAGGALPGPPAVEAENLAYLIFTSGSTGVPKAVALTHGGLAHMAGWVRQSFALGPQDRGTQVAAPAFDASVFEIWPFLTAGASLHRCP